MTTPSRDHDGTYRKLFEDPVVFKEFLETFVDLDILAKLDLSKPRAMDTAFMAESLLRRIPDRMWRVRTRAPPHRDVVILLEFQSSIDRTMPMRIMGYIALLYQYLAQQKGWDGRVPFVIPVVLYNGKATWHEPVYLRQLILPQPEIEDEHLVPRTTFELVDIHRLSTARLEHNDDLMSLFFRFEQYKKLKDFPSLIDTLIEKLEEERYTDMLRRGVAVWVHELLKSRGLSLESEHINSILEVKMMIFDHLDEIMAKELGEARERGLQEGRQEGLEQGLVEGREKGREEGRKEGREEGHSLARAAIVERQRELVLKQLSLKFGPDQKREARVADLSLEKLEDLMLAIITADDESELDY